MRYTAILFPMLFLAVPPIAEAADSADDGIVILSVTPRDPGVKGEILLTPVKRPAVTAKEGAGGGGGAPEPARTAQAAQGARPPSR